jgi:ABC-type nitrate/sulfonate/bicarbonate transport system permease component
MSRSSCLVAGTWSLLGICSIWVLAWLLRQDDPIRYHDVSLPATLLAVGIAAVDPVEIIGLYSTLWVTAKSFVVGGLLAAVAGIILSCWPIVSERAMFFVHALRAVPLTLLIPFTTVCPVFLVLPPGVTSTAPSRDPAVLVALGTFLYLLVGVSEGIAGRDHERERILKRVRRLSHWDYVRVALFWEALPSVVTAARVALLFALVLSIVLEQLLQYPGVGLRIQELMMNANPYERLGSRALALIVIVAGLGVVLDWGLRRLRRRVGRWQEALR